MRSSHPTESDGTLWLSSSAVRTVRRAVQSVLGRTANDFEDATQDALLAVHRALRAYRGEASLERFACCIAMRVALTARRRRSTQRKRFVANGNIERVPTPAPGVLDRGAHRDALRHSKQLATARLLECLPAAQAEAFALRVVWGCSLEEVAQRTGVPLNTVRSRMRLAKRALRHLVERDARFEELQQSNDQLPPATLQARSR